MARLRIPEYVEVEIKKAGGEIVAQGHNGTGHVDVEFKLPNGVKSKWSLPHLGKCDPRAFMNNKSQLRHYLRGMCEKEARA